MADPIKNEMTMSICAKDLAPKDEDMKSAAMQYAQKVCGNDHVWSSFEAEVTDAGKKLIDDSNYYCKNVNVSFFCTEPQPVKGSNPRWERGSPKQKEQPVVHKKDYL